MPVKPTKVLLIPVGFGTISLNDSTTYYFSNNPRGPATVYDYRRLQIPIACKIIKSYITVCSDNGAGTNEGLVLYFRKNDTTDTTIGTVASTSTHREFQNETLNIDMIPTDHFTIKMVTPAWVTNPDSVSANGFLLAIC